MSDYTKFWGLYRVGRAFGYRDPIYAGGWHRGQDVPGAVSGTPWIGKKIPLLHPKAPLYYSGIKTKLGGVRVYKVGGEFWTYCHTVPLAGGAFRLADWSDAKTWQGTSWGGPHLHVVRSKTWDAAWNTNRVVMDPRPVIDNMLAAATTTPSKPRPVPVPEPEPIPEPQPEPVEIMEKIMSATPFFATVSQSGTNRTKTFFCQPNPLAASTPSAKPFLGFLWRGKTEGFPVLDATGKYEYAYVERHVQDVNTN